MDERKTTVGSGANGPHVRGGSSDEIKRDIDRTRYEMDETLDELSERLQPRHILDDILDMFRSDTGGAGTARVVAQRTGRNLVHQIQENPVPLALIGAGIAWMMVSGRKDDAYYYGDPLPYPDDPRYDLYEVGIEYGYEMDTDVEPGMYPQGEPGYYASTSMTTGEGGGEGRTARAGDKVKGAAEGAKSKAGAAKDAAGARARAAGESAKEAVSSVAERGRQAASRAGHGMSSAASRARQGMSRAGHSIGDAASSTAEGARHAAHTARIRAEQMGRRARYRGRVVGHQMQEGARELQHKAYRGYRYGREEVSHGIEEHPLGMGMGFFALGILAGLSLPHTRREDELIGDWSDEMKNRVAESGQEIVNRGVNTARETARTARSEMQREGLTPSALTEKFARIVLDSEEAAREAAEREGLTVSQLREKAQHVMDEAAKKAKSESKELKEAAKDEAHRHKEEIKSEAKTTSS
jgi:hypothetical protein